MSQLFPYRRTWYSFSAIPKNTKKLTLWALVAVLALSQVIFLFSPKVEAASNVIYDSIDDLDPGNVPSLGYQATQTSEFGSQVGLAGTDRDNPVVTVLMSSWACEEGHWTSNDCETSTGATFSHPVTLNIYEVDSGDAVGSLLATKTEDFDLLYRPSADNTNCTGDDAGKWFDGEDCNNGIAFPISFDFTGTTLPDEVIIGVAYNTTSYGESPLGTSTACYSTAEGCPYDSLNVGTNPSTLTGDTLPGDDNDAYWNTTTANYYCDAGAGGTGTFRLDEDCWEGYLPALRIEAETFSYVVDGKIRICHATASPSNPFNSIEVNVNSLDNAHGVNDHTEDVVPPFEDEPNGRNWDAEGIALWENDCGDGEVLGEQCEAGPGWAAIVVDSDQGTTKNGGDIQAARTNPDNALGEDDGSFFSLGVEGWIEVEFNGYVTNEPGDDLSFHELTNGRAGYPEEVADIEVSQNGSDWYPVGSVGNHDGGDGVGYVDFDSTGLDWIKYVRVTEATDFSLHSSNADGYDLDAVDATNIVCDEPQHIPQAKLIAHKIVCTNEEDLPNWGNGGPNITADTAEAFVAQHEDCDFAEDWSYQWIVNSSSGQNPGDNVGEAGDPWTTFTADGEMAMTWVPLNGNKTIQVREVLQENYIPFTGNQSDDDVTAEFYCNTDVTNYDNLDWIKKPKDGATYYCVAFNVPIRQTFTLHADKIICEAEKYLPNWGDGDDQSSINETTAQDFVNDSEGHCWFGKWLFQWAPQTANPGDHEEEAGDPWSTFGGWVEIDKQDLEDGNRIWVREVYNDNYVEFTGANTTQNVSAELYCGNDVLNYDNYDYVLNPEADNNYYCVAFNALKPVTLSAQKVTCAAEEFLPNWGGGAANITATTAQDYVDDSEGNCRLSEWDFQISLNSNPGNPGDNTGEAGDPWQTFNETDGFTFELSEVSGDRVWVREVWSDGWVKFSGDTTNPRDEDISAELYCSSDVLNYDNYDFVNNLQPGETYYCVGFNAPPAGAIQGIVYNDLNSDGIQQNPQEEGLNGIDVWLLTHNSPFTLAGVRTTDNSNIGDYLFNNLQLGTYYVCQDVQSGWLQTQLNNAGSGGFELAALNIGDEIPGDEADVQAVIDEFCYTVILDQDNPISVARDFGNFQPQVNGLTTEEGNVLGASTEGEVLAATGEGVFVPIVVGLMTMLTAGSLAVLSRRKTIYQN